MGRDKILDDTKKVQIPFCTQIKLVNLVGGRKKAQLIAIKAIEEEASKQNNV